MSEMRTFVFTDIAQSVTLKGHMAGANDAERDEAFVSTILSPHRRHIEQDLPRFGGRVVSTAGDGHFLVFANTINAASWAVAVQQRHATQPVDVPGSEPVGVRMSLHVGFPQADPSDPNNFIGRVVDYAARLNDHAASGQILISAAALGLLQDAGLDGVVFHSHGPMELRGIGSVEVHELLYSGRKPSAPRTAPSRVKQRDWTVLPATMGLTEYAQQAGSSGGVATPAAPAKRLGNYELGELLGAGGMGAVYRARHTQFDRDRAVKVIKPSLLPHGQSDSDGEVIRRFYREIKAIGALDHPNIVVAIDSSSPTDETHFLVMEYVDGVGADRLVELLGPLPPAAACAVARQAALGLDYLHRQGMVHRDIKPSNLMLTLVDRSGMPHHDSATNASPHAPLVKILDLGLALLVTENEPRLTQMGQGAMGTAYYMSPEQWSTTSVDIRSDIYSLGCTLYHLIAGRPPFVDSDLKPQRAHEQAPIPTDFGQKGIPKALPKLLRKMMAKAPDDRFTRPSEVAEALAELAEDEALTTTIEEARRAAARMSTVPGPVPAETRLTGAGARETLIPHPPASGQPGWHAPPRPRPWWRRLATPLAIALTAAAALYMAQVASQRQRSLDEARRQSQEALRDTLIVPAGLAASLLATEIDTRFEILTRLGRDKVIREALATVDPTDRSTWRDAQRWIVEKKALNDRVAATSWFLVYADGTQVARAKPSKTLGNAYGYRDYFHGGGRDLPKDQTGRPTTEPVLSSVYRSDSTKLLKVAFSAPIWRDGNTGDPADVLGVLGMSVDLGSFRVLEDAERLPDSLEVVLIDLREDALGPMPDPGEGPRRGLLLHHPKLAEYEVPSDPFRLPAPLLQRVDDALSRATRTGRLSNPIIEGYDDLLGRRGRGQYIGAFEPVVVRNPDEQRDTRLLVIVQRKQ
ncbi:MAG: protein kinase [Planctomycetota bacterium]